MKAFEKTITQLGVIWLICFGLFNLQLVWAESNISTTYKYAWSENVGWQNWRSANATATVAPTYGNTTKDNRGVNKDTATGALSGYAWSENVGWINFNPSNSQVTIDTTTLKFNGYVWAENI